MLDYVVQVTKDATRITPEHHDRLRAAGFDDRAILQITLITAWFNYIPRVGDALGVGGGCRLPCFTASGLHRAGVAGIAGHAGVGGSTGAGGPAAGIGAIDPCCSGVSCRTTGTGRPSVRLAIHIRAMVELDATTIGKDGVALGIAPVAAVATVS